MTVLQCVYKWLCGILSRLVPSETQFRAQIAEPRFGLYVNMTCGMNRSTASCGGVVPGWGSNDGNLSSGLDPDVTMAGVARHKDHFFSHELFYDQAANGSLPAFSWISPPHEPGSTNLG